MPRNSSLQVLKLQKASRPRSQTELARASPKVYAQEQLTNEQVLSPQAPPKRRVPGVLTVSGSEGLGLLGFRV